jgi:hypothetical protein
MSSGFHSSESGAVDTDAAEWSESHGLKPIVEVPLRGGEDSEEGADRVRGSHREHGERASAGGDADQEEDDEDNEEDEDPDGIRTHEKHLRDRAICCHFVMRIFLEVYNASGLNPY